MISLFFIGGKSLKIYILAGGPIQYVPDLNKINESGITWAGVDRGVHHLLSMGIAPSEAFGDFDSVTEAELSLMRGKLVHLNMYPAEKDQTDLEIALGWAAGKKPDEILLFGATGGRADHYLGNIQLLARHIQDEPGTRICMIDKTNQIFAAKPGSYTLVKEEDKKYISFIPLTPEVKAITLKGFKYPLENRNIKLGSTLCISNELLYEEGTFSFKEGILLVVRSSD
ncbi:thiamine diphosphokinase [Peribacillus sp. SCS-37]|uniref:thiamine diphosphokinase n=1 Tax=Paraperibacillus esterisolvens TaxID=3115296 RepID=UPI003905CDE2